jgi:hypothetical protein
MTRNAILMSIRFVVIAALTFAFWGGGVAQAQDAKPDVPQVETYYGLWRDADDRPIFFERKGIDDPTSNKYVTGKTVVKGQKEAREWTGHYDAGKLHLTYRPQAEEMSAKLPLWVRKEAFKQVLRWRLEVAAVPQCGAEDTIVVKWFPGELKWDEGPAEKPESVKIVGEGKPIEITYKRDMEIEIDLASAPAMALYVSPTAFIDSADVKYITLRESFRIDVLLPRSQAEAQGEKLPIRFSSKASGKSLTIELTRAPAANMPAVRYTTKEAIKGEALEPIYGTKIGDFRGDTITASFGELSYEIKLFASAEARALHRVYDALSEHEALWLTHVQSPTLSRQEKESAQQRLRLIRNAKKFADRESTLFQQRFAVVSAYLSSDGKDGLILQEKLTWIHDDRVGKEATIRTPSGVASLGFSWAAEEEISAVTRVYLATNQIIAKELSKATFFAMYDTYVAMTRAEHIMVVFFGVDHHGKRVSGVDRASAIGRFFVPDPTNPLDWFKFAQASASFVRATRRLGKAITRTDLLRGPKPSLGGLPSGMTARVRASPKGHAATRPPAEALDECFGDLGTPSSSDGHAHPVYPKSFKLYPGGALPQHGQQFPAGCQIGAFAHLHEGQTGLKLDQMGLKRFLQIDMIERGEPLRNIAVTRGLSGAEFDRLVHATGGETVPLRLEPSGITLIHESTDGWGIVLRVKPDKGPKHAIVLKAIERDAATGKQSRIVFFDPDVRNPMTGQKGHIVYTDTPCDFWRILYRSPDPESATAVLVRWRIGSSVTGR